MIRRFSLMFYLFILCRSIKTFGNVFLCFDDYIVCIYIYLSYINCFLFFQPTKLNVYKNDAESWDFTNPNVGKCRIHFFLDLMVSNSRRSQSPPPLSFPSSPLPSLPPPSFRLPFSLPFTLFHNLSSLLSPSPQNFWVEVNPVPV